MTREEAIVVLQKIKPIPHRGDSKSTTHILETIALEMAIKALKQQLTRPTSRWSRQTDTYHDYYECENCGIGVGLDDVRNFCPNCGAKMQEVEE